MSSSLNPGKQHCPTCGRPIPAGTLGAVTDATYHITAKVTDVTTQAHWHNPDPVLHTGKGTP